MMKPKEIYNRCEHCDALILECSPPTKDAYAKSQVCIWEGRILLPENVVKNKHRDGVSDSHCIMLDGFYCSAKCFIDHINEALSVTTINVEYIDNSSDSVKSQLEAIGEDLLEINRRLNAFEKEDANRPKPTMEPMKAEKMRL